MASLPDPEIEGIDELASLDIDDSAIYRAREVRHHRLVAIKILDPICKPLLPPRRFHLRRRPLHAFAESDGVVPVYRVGTTGDGDRFLMMPYYRAGSLADQLAYGSTPWHASADLVARTAEILAAGHAAGVVLSGIKPSSILLADATTPLLAVYGMATRRIDDRPCYRAPEVGRRGPATSAADVYSLGLTLAALIAGRPPGGGVRTRELTADLEAVAPARIVEVIARATEEAPERRIRTAGELAVALRAAIDGDRIPEQPPPPGTVSTTDRDAILDPDLDLMLAPASPSPTTSTSTSTTDDAETATAERVIRTTPPPLPPPTARPAPTFRSPGQPGQDSAPAAVAASRVDQEADRRSAEASDPTSSDLLTTAATIAPASIDLTTIEEPVDDPSVVDEHDGTVAEPDDDRSPGRSLVTVDNPVTPEGAGAAEHPPAIDLTGDEPPFRAFDRPPRTTPTPGRFVHMLDPLQVAWLQIRRSAGALLAVITLLVIAGIVVMLVIQQRQPASTQVGAVAPLDLPTADAEPPRDPSTVRPSSAAPALLEPGGSGRTTSTGAGLRSPSTPGPTSSAGAAGGRPATTGARPSASTTPASAGATSSTASGPTGSAVGTARPSTAPSTTRPSASTTTTTAASTSASTGSTGPTIEVSVGRLRPTSARVRVTSPSCVTTTFTWSRAGAAPGEGGGGSVGGGSRCSTSLTLNLGRATAALTPDTTYTVRVTAIDANGRSTASTVTFTTLP